jgi:CRP-like cAMP-binding protein
MSPPAPAAPGNLLLAHLPRDEYLRLLPRLRRVPLKLKQVLYEAGAAMNHAYFPTRGIVSSVLVMENGSTIEVATMGREGVVGLPVFNRAEASFTRVIVQIAGEALRMEALALEEEARPGGPFRQLLLRAQAAFLARVSQGVACNGLHTVRQRCCRWLLEMWDRLEADALPITHEFLAQMLGVRRATVSEILEPLQGDGLIRSGRGKITILDRVRLKATSCECHRSINDEYDRLFGWCQRPGVS